MILGIIRIAIGLIVIIAALIISTMLGIVITNTLIRFADFLSDIDPLIKGCVAIIFMLLIILFIAFKIGSFIII